MVTAMPVDSRRASPLGINPRLGVQAHRSLNLRGRLLHLHDRWVQAEYRRLGNADNPKVGELLKTAVRCLKERPVLFKYCAEEVANMRHNALFRWFISVLTRGGPGGLPRPIEVHAHDPLRYVGDMLGWLHQALASERELVLVLLDPEAAVDSRPTARQFSSKAEDDFGVSLPPLLKMSSAPTHLVTAAGGDPNAAIREKERTREQKAKALAKLKELDRRKLTENQTQKLECNAVQLKQEEKSAWVTVTNSHWH